MSRSTTPLGQSCRCQRLHLAVLTDNMPLGQVLGQRIRIPSCAAAKGHVEGHTKGVPRLLKGDTEATLGGRVAVNGHHSGMRRVKTRRAHETVGTRPRTGHGQLTAGANPPFCRVWAGSTTKFTNRSRTFCSSSTFASGHLPNPFPANSHYCAFARLALVLARNQLTWATGGRSTTNHLHNEGKHDHGGYSAPTTRILSRILQLHSDGLARGFGSRPDDYTLHFCRQSWTFLNNSNNYNITSSVPRPSGPSCLVGRSVILGNFGFFLG